jgi:hypothetical protein
VRHIAVHTQSFHDPGRPFTATGLGDRIHSATIAWVYGQCTGEPVTLHLSERHLAGGQFKNKPESWAEIVRLFPRGSVYLSTTGEGDSYFYGDYKLGRGAIDIAPYLKRIPLLAAEPQDIELPGKFVTTQWDSGGESRTLPRAERRAVTERYESEGYTPVVVGGESTDDRLRWSLKHIAYAMSRSAFHVGVDSAFLHMAQLYMPCERIHLYMNAKPSHHVLRARDNGAQINLHL